MSSSSKGGVAVDRGSKPTHIVWWMKKNFRLSDNPALTRVLESGLKVLPVFVLEPSALKAPETSAFHVAAWFDALKDLRSQLAETGGDVLV